MEKSFFDRIALPGSYYTSRQQSGRGGSDDPVGLDWFKLSATS
ncbi:MAG: hypothetical protein ANABAC_0093 [Anaerolineae bacterium]|nr:MAG: hypothetical protein ANABAC_0093 [Anaerolineae bacterium]